MLYFGVNIDSEIYFSYLEAFSSAHKYVGTTLDKLIFLGINSTVMNTLLMTQEWFDISL